MHILRYIHYMCTLYYMWYDKDFLNKFFRDLGNLTTWFSHVVNYIWLH